MTEEPFDPDWKHLADLATFAAIEVESGDLEPWAELIRDLHERGVLDVAQAHWVVKLYNAYDAIGSAWQVYRRWESPLAWALAPDADEAEQYPCTQERRNLRGGRVLHHLDDYASRLGGLDEEQWLRAALVGATPEENFQRLLARMRDVWGVGRQSAFEWAEFLAKALAYPIAAPDAELWESEGPRRSLQRLYGNPTPTVGWLNRAADHARQHLLDVHGIDLSWLDFETVICDFNVMRDGRYYPGRHLAALREEIDDLPRVDDRWQLNESWERIVPSAWRSIAPGIDKAKLTVYRDTGKIRDFA